MLFGRAVSILTCAVCALGCSGSNAPSGPSQGKLERGVVARVGPTNLTRELVAEIARAQDVDFATARQRAISDTLFALEAGKRFQTTGPPEVAERVALARAMFEDFTRAAVEQGPVTTQEIETLAKKRWQDFDRPEAARVTHAVALVEPGKDPAPARKLAQQLAEKLAGITDPKKFITTALAFPARRPGIQAEQLPPCTSDGRVVGGEPGATFDPRFAHAANLLREPGEQSPVIESSFGFHVILLEERLPEKRLGFEERRAALSGDVITNRAQKLSQKALAGLRKGTAVEVARNSLELMGQVESLP
jgi:hypothetical protein